MSGDVAGDVAVADPSEGEDGDSCLMVMIMHFTCKNVSQMLP